MRILTFLAVLCTPSVLMAQSWATAQMCIKTPPALHDSAFAPEGLEALRTRATDIDNGRGRFWRITAPEGQISYLWGTQRASTPEILALPAQVEAQIKTARVVAIESDHSFQSRAALVREQERGDWFEPEPAADLVALARNEPQVMGWIATRLEATGLIFAGTLPHLRAGTLVEALQQDVCEDFNAGVLPVQDVRIQMLGRIAGAEILSLEAPGSVRDHLNQPENRALALTTMLYLGTALDPTQTPKHRASHRALYLQGEIGVMQAWQDARVTRLFGPRASDLRQQAEGYLLKARSRNFIAAAQDALKTGDTFLAVGAAHLPGKAGMVALLRQAGYQVERIPLPGEAP